MARQLNACAGGTVNTCSGQWSVVSGQQANSPSDHWPLVTGHYARTSSIYFLPAFVRRCSFPGLKG